MTDPLDSTVAALGLAQQRLDAEVLPQYGATPEPVETDPRVDLAQSDDQRGEQTITLLQLLGYLREPDSAQAADGQWIWPAAEIEAAWAAWRDDRIALALAPVPSVRIATEANAAAVEDEDRLRRDLKACATLEGEVTLTGWPESGSVSLATRIVLMRLRTFGLSESTAAMPLPALLENELLARAARIAAGLGLSAADIIDRLGDIAGLTRVVQDRLRGRFSVLQVPAAGPGPHGVQPLRTTEDKIHALNPADQNMADWNRFSLRLLQVRLWTLGYYQGEVDGHWGPMSHASLERFLGDFEVENPASLCGSVKGGYVVLDIAAVLDLFGREVDAPAGALERGQIDELLSTEAEKDDSELLDALQKYRATRSAAGAVRPGAMPEARYVGDDFMVASTENVRRKRYFGWRGIFASFGRFIRRVAGKVVNFVRELIAAIRKGLGYVRNIIAYAMNATRVAVRVAALAIRRFHCWLTGTPVVTPLATGGLGAATFWQHDHDTINLIGTACPPGIVDRHQRLLDWMQSSVGIMLEIAAAIVGAVLALGNWLLFAWRVLKTIRLVIQQTRNPLFGELLAETAAT